MFRCIDETREWMVWFYGKQWCMTLFKVEMGGQVTGEGGARGYPGYTPVNFARG